MNLILRELALISSLVSKKVVVSNEDKRLFHPA